MRRIEEIFSSDRFAGRLMIHTNQIRDPLGESPDGAGILKERFRRGMLDRGQQSGKH